MRISLFFPPVLLLSVLITTACDSPVKSPPISAFPVMAPDGLHIVVGFPDALLGPILPSQVRVFQSDGAPLDVDSAVVDTLSGTLLIIRTRQPYDWHQQLTMQISGLIYERGEAVSDRPLGIGAAPGLRYARDIAPLFSAKCSSCHDAGTPSGGYRTDSRGALYAFGSDSLDMNRSPNLIPGNDRCQLAIKTSPHGREFNRAGLSFFESELIRQWILNGDAADPPANGLEKGIAAQAADFTHLWIAFASHPDPGEAEQTGRYHITDLDEAGVSFFPADVALDSDLGEIARLDVPKQKPFHHYRVTVDRIADRYGAPLFDSASIEFRAVLSYAADIAPLMSRSCTHCHGPSIPDSLRGFYLTDSYEALYAYGSDSTAATRSRNLLPTDSACLLVTKVRQSGGKAGKCALRARLTPMESHRIADWAVSFYAREH